MVVWNSTLGLCQTMVCMVCFTKHSERSLVYIRNDDLHTDLNIPKVKDDIKNYTKKH